MSRVHANLDCREERCSDSRFYAEMGKKVVPRLRESHLLTPLAAGTSSRNLGPPLSPSPVLGLNADSKGGIGYRAAHLPSPAFCKAFNCLQSKHQDGGESQTSEKAEECTAHQIAVENNCVDEGIRVSPCSPPGAGKYRCDHKPHENLVVCCKNEEMSAENLRLQCLKCLFLKFSPSVTCLLSA